MAASVTEVLSTIVHVETALSPPESVLRLEREFVRLLTEQVAARRGYRVTSAFNIATGVDIAAERRRLRETADVVIEADSNAARLDHYPGRTTRRPVKVALDGVAAGAVPATDVVHCAEPPFNQCPNRNAKVRHVTAVLALVADRMAEPAPLSESARSTSEEDSQERCSRRNPEQLAHSLAARRPLATQPVSPRVGVTSFASPDATAEPFAGLGADAAGGSPRRLSDPEPAVERLMSWATDDSANAQHLCALLGDVGMGKTTTIKLFTEALLQRREQDPSTPLPILFDLRDLPPQIARDGAGIARILDALLEAGDLGNGRPSAAQVLDIIATEPCVLIFDGLDEVLVHLDPHSGQRFTRTLWRATEDGHTARNTGRPSRLLLSCRTHYFRSIRHETTHFTGQHRDGPAGEDYLALLMLPFSEAQVRTYLTANVPGRDVDGLLKLIDNVHNLREIAQRPLTLRMLAEQLEAVEHAKLNGHTVRAVDLYGLFVAQWLERDDGKHRLLPEHKQLLMEDLAARLWRDRRTTCSVEDAEQWMLEFLAHRPDLELHYAARTPDLWKEDLRTATFLIRHNDETFGFAHTSLREYFLARHLGRALDLPSRPSSEVSADSARKHWRLPVPSPETLDFLGQWLAGRDEPTRARCMATLTALTRPAQSDKVNRSGSVGGSDPWEGSPGTSRSSGRRPSYSFHQTTTDNQAGRGTARSRRPAAA